MKVLLIVAFLGLALAAPQPPQIKFRNLYKKPLANPHRQATSGRIVNGNVAKPHSIPYQAFLTVDSAYSAGWYCGGSLIAENFVLTSGQCVWTATEVSVTLGAVSPFSTIDDPVVIKSSEIIIYPNFNLAKRNYDIALVRLSSKAPLGPNIKLVNLPDYDTKYTGEIARASGWGYTKGLNHFPSIELRYIENPVLPNSECDKVFGFIWGYQLCVSGEGNKTICDVDTGGPLTVDGVQIGVVSYSSYTCDVGYPSFYTSVQFFLSWIKENLKKEKIV